MSEQYDSEEKDTEAGDLGQSGKTASRFEEVDFNTDVHTGIRDGLQRGMKQRHVQAIAIAGTLGTGLFLSSGRAIVYSGPAGALIAYLLIGSVVWSMVLSLGELLVFAPISGGYILYADRYVHPSLGFAMGWMQWYAGAVSLPSEIISATLIIGFWTEIDTPQLCGYITLLFVLSASINYFGVRWFGESEFWFALIKIALILGLIIGGLVVDLGGGPNHDRIGFRYWKSPGAFASYPLPGNIGILTGWFSTLVQAAYSFSGVEAIAFTVGELQNPRKNTTRAVNRIFYRILFFYFFGILIIGMLVPSDDPGLLSYTGTAADSPFVLAFERAGIKVLPSIVNAGVLTSAFSAANSVLYGTSRVLYGLALRGQAPKIFARTTKRGLPLPSLLITTSFFLLSYMAVSSGASTVLTWLSNLVSIASFITWGCICIIFLRWKKAMEAQGYDRSASKFLYVRWQPFPAYWAIFWCSLVIFFNGYTVFLSGAWNISDFVIAYVNIPFFGALFLGHWLFTGRRPFRKDSEIDLVSNIPGPEIDVDINPPTSRIGKFFTWLL